MPTSSHAVLVAKDSSAALVQFSSSSELVLHELVVTDVDELSLASLVAVYAPSVRITGARIRNVHLGDGTVFAMEGAPTPLGEVSVSVTDLRVDNTTAAHVLHTPSALHLHVSNSTFSDVTVLPGPHGFCGLAMCDACGQAAFDGVTVTNS